MIYGLILVVGGAYSHIKYIYPAATPRYARTYVHHPLLVLHEPHRGAVPRAAQADAAGVHVDDLVAVLGRDDAAAHGWGWKGGWVDYGLRNACLYYTHAKHTHIHITCKGVLHLLEGAPRDAREEARLRAPRVPPRAPCRFWLVGWMRFCMCVLMGGVDGLDRVRWVV